MSLQEIALIFSTLANILLGVFIYLKGPKNALNIIYTSVSFSIAFWAGMLALFLIIPLQAVIFPTKLLYVAASFIVGTFVYFAWAFPRVKFEPKLAKRIVVLTPVVLMVYLSLYTDYLIRGVEIIGDKRKILFFAPGYVFYSIFIVTYFVIAFYLLIKKYEKSAGILRMQIRYILLGSLLSTIPAVTTDLILPAFGYFDLLWIGPVFTLFMVGFMAYTIARYRLLEIRAAISRGILYTVLVLLVASIFSFSAILVGRFVGTAYNINSFLITILVSIVIVMSIDPLKRSIASLTDRIFFQKEIDYQKVLRIITDLIAREIDLDVLIYSFSKKIVKEMRLKKVLILLKDKRDGDFKPYKTKSGPIFEAESELIQYLEKQARVVITEELEREALSQEAKTKELKPVVEQFKEWDIKLAAPIIVEDNMTGIILAWQKRSGEAYNIQDVQLLEVVSKGLSTAIEKAKLYEEVQNFNKVLREKIDKATKELREANIHLQQLDKAKSEFLSIAAHQLRTPLSGIKGYLSMFLEGDFGKLPPEQYKIVGDLFENTNRLTRLVNIFLNVSRIEAGKFSLDKIKINILNLVREVVKELKTVAENKKLEINLEEPKKILPDVSVDKDKIHDVLMNLVDNAIKYTQEGGINIKLDLIQSPKNKKVKVSIKDTGIGIGPEDANNLFTKFVRGSGITQIHTDGSGLGLFIAKKIIEAHGGEIGVKSEGEGKGSEFWFTIPV